MQNAIAAYLASKTIDDLKMNFATVEELVLNGKPKQDTENLETATIDMLKTMNVPTPGALAYRLTH